MSILRNRTGFVMLAIFMLADSARAFAATPQVTRCHMDSCSWMKISRKTQFGSNNQATIYEIQSQIGYSDNDALANKGIYSKRIKIEWDKPETFHVRCSAYYPIVYTGGFDPRSPGEAISIRLISYSGSEEHVNSIYSYVCFGNSQYWLTKDKRLKAMGYGKTDRNDLEGLRISSPQDLLDLGKKP